VRAGFDSIRLTVRLAGSEPLERYEQLHETVARCCPVLDALASPVKVTTHLDLET